MKLIDKSKLVLVHSKDKIINDVPLETKEISYYKDSWYRFKKNKASLVAFYILIFIITLVIVGPSLKIYDLPTTNSTNASRLGNLNAKIPFLENLGVFDGTKTITRGKEFLLTMNSVEFGRGIIISGIPLELIEDPNHPAYADIDELTVKVDYYKYTNYITSYMPENYYGIIQSNYINDANEDPLGGVRRTITEDKFEEYMSKNYIIDVLQIIQSPNLNDPDTPYVQYEVRLNQFLVSLDQTPEDTYFWFGTTNLGEDLFTKIWQGARISIVMALTVLLINTTVGLVIGAIAGYYGGIFDLLFDRFVEIISSIPFLSVLTLLTLRYGSDTWVIILAFTATGWIGSYKTGRMQFYRFKNREYVLAARTLGAKDKRIMFKHIFPNTLGLIVTSSALAVPAFVFTEASFSFLGIINYSDATSVGMLIQQGQAVMQTHPHLLIFPSLYIAILMITFNLFGNGLRDAFNPSLRGVE
jgi:oligopeptide transport system permease protein